MNSTAREDEAARELDSRIAAFIARAPAGFTAPGATAAERWGIDAGEARALDSEFESLALQLFAYQTERIPVYRDYAALANGTRPPEAANEVPPLPVEAFKSARIAAFPPDRDRVMFHTSGTTGASAGVLVLDDPSLYRLSLERGFRHHVVPDRDVIRMLVVAAPAAAAPHSSLSFMFDHVLRRFGAPGSGCFWDGGGARWPELRTALLGAARSAEPVCLLGTAFTWVHVADRFATEGFRVHLPPGSRLLETGGYKGRSRRLERSELLALVEHTFGVPPTHVVGEYGMTELASQYYTTSLRGALTGMDLDDVWSHPAWLRPRIVDAESGRAMSPDDARETGLLAHHDLANRGSAAHVLSADLAHPAHGSFVLAGRSRDAEPRGCGLAYESSDMP